MIGMDIGTTYSKVACVSPAGRPASILDDRGQAQIPSVVFLPQNGKPLVGVDAVEQGYVEPERCARLFKLKLGTQDSVVGNGAKFDATDAAATIIAHLKECTEQSIGKAVVECVATCPANFKDNSKQALLEAFYRNNIKVLKLLPEPTAAGFAYSLNTARTQMRIIVHNFGEAPLTPPCSPSKEHRLPCCPPRASRSSAETT